jgi:AcrR family transcriptional regulator
MAAGSVERTRFERRRAVRAGRPPRELAGEVDSRILDAARQAFLERGLAGASVDEIASLARAGKPTIYARFSSKEALFRAVMARSIAANIAQAESQMPTGETIEERLASVGNLFLHWALASDTIDLMRLAIAEARRFPELASSVQQMARERGAEAAARLLAEAAQSDGPAALPAFAPDHLAATTELYLDLVLTPPLVRALFGGKLKRLRAEIETHVARSVAFFLAACRQGV